MANFDEASELAVQNGAKPSIGDCLTNRSLCRLRTQPYPFLREEQKKMFGGLMWHLPSDCSIGSLERSLFWENDCIMYFCQVL